jgi:hypothetical protein
MTAATRTDTSVTTLPITVSSFFTALKTALTNSGFPSTVFENQVGSGYIVYEITVGSGFTKGKIYLKINASLSGSEITVTYSIFDSWDAVAHTGANEGTQSNFSASININNNVYFSAFNHDEARFVCVSQFAPLIGIIGYVRPATKYSWWNENSFPFAFIPDNNQFRGFNACGAAATPYNVSSTYSFPLLAMQDANPISGKRDIKPAPDILSPSNQGIAGTFSSDLVLCASRGTSKFDLIYISSTEIYTLIYPADNSGFAIRTT